MAPTVLKHLWTVDPVLGQLNAIHILTSRFSVKLSSHLNICPQSGLLPSGFQTKIFIWISHFSLVCCNVPPILFLIWSHKIHLVNSTNYKASHYYNSHYPPVISSLLDSKLILSFYSQTAPVCLFSGFKDPMWHP